MTRRVLSRGSFKTSFPLTGGRKHPSNSSLYSLIIHFHVQHYLIPLMVEDFREIFSLFPVDRIPRQQSPQAPEKEATEILVPGIDTGMLRRPRGQTLSRQCWRTDRRTAACGWFYTQSHRCLCRPAGASHVTRLSADKQRTRVKNWTEQLSNNTARNSWPRKKYGSMLELITGPSTKDDITCYLYRLCSTVDCTAFKDSLLV